MNILAPRQSGLGKGLGALIPRPSSAPPEMAQPEIQDAPADTLEGRVLQIPVERIERNPQQPRVHFDHHQLEDLISSIKEYGVIQPLVVSALGDGRYQLIAGERRLRASSIAGLATVPAIVRDATEQQKLELAIIENVQREDLNPIEEARAYQRLSAEFNLTQDDVARKVGRSRPYVTNIMRLLNLPEVIQQALIERKISSSNGRTLLSLPSDAQRLELFQAMLASNFTVRETERRVGYGYRPRVVDAYLSDLEGRLRDRLHCRVDIRRKPEGNGDIVLSFSSEEELRAVVERVCGASA